MRLSSSATSCGSPPAANCLRGDPRARAAAGRDHRRGRGGGVRGGRPRSSSITALPSGGSYAALESYREVLAGADALEDGQILALCRQACDLPAALAAIDLALWDRAGRRSGQPIAALLAAHPAGRIAVNQAISALDVGVAAEQAAAAVALGFACLKLKVGFGDDAARAAAVREAAGPQTALRLDANGAWGTDEAVQNIERLAHLGARVGRGGRPTASTRSGPCGRARGRAWPSMRRQPRTALSSAGAADAVCSKISRCGGSRRARRQLNLVQQASSGSRHLPRLNLRRTARDRRRHACSRGARRTWPARALRPGHALPPLRAASRGPGSRSATGRSRFPTGRALEFSRSAARPRTPGPGAAGDSSASAVVLPAAPTGARMRAAARACVLASARYFLSLWPTTTATGMFESSPKRSQKRGHLAAAGTSPRR